MANSLAHIRKKRKAARRKSKRSFALLTVGIGLILLGIAAALLLPRSDAAGTTGEASSNPAGVRSVVPVEVDYPAPELQLSNLSGQPVALADYRGQVVLVNNWAVWCPPCKAELPDMQAYYDAHKHQGFTLIGIESGDSPAQVQDFVDSAGLTFSIWIDLKQDALIAFRNMSLPSSYVIDETGQIRLAWSGAISYEMLEKHVTPLLGN